VLYGDPYDPCLNFDLDLMVGLSDEADAALRALRTAANQVKRWVRLDTGDLLVIDNRRAVHARSQFTARFDGTDRWLQRMCAIRDLLPSAADRRSGSRVVETAFAF
jgi:alpha-ketoglutarate-dependent taurine dioxygenase